MGQDNNKTKKGLTPAMSTALYEHRTGPQPNKYAHLAKHLQDNPGTWAKVRTAETDNGAYVAAHQIRTGRRAAFRPAGHYEAYAEDREVIARYVGATN